MKRLVTAAFGLLALLVGLGLGAGAISAAHADSASGDAASDSASFALNRDDDVADIATFDDDDEADDEADDTYTGQSKPSNDTTNSRVTKVSRNQDISRGDKTRDWTMDGGKKKRDYSANNTNDRSRNDTRR